MTQTHEHEGGGPRWPRRLLIIAAVLAAGALLVFGGILPRRKAAAEVREDTQQLAVPTVEVVTPKRAAPTQDLVLPGNIMAFTDAPIYARTNGYLKRWYADIGTHVRTGQLLADIESPEVDQELQQARADLGTARANEELARITADRYKDLASTDSVAKQDVDNAVGNYVAKQAMTNSAESNVKRLEELQSFEKIYAPFDGVITARNTDIGQLIDSGSGTTAKELFHLAATRKLRVYVYVPQVYSQAARPGLIADLTLAEFPGKRFSGKLVRNADAINAASRTLQTEVDVDNSSGQLLPGAYAEVHFKLPESVSAHLLPVNTLIFRADGMHVGIVKDGKHAVLEPVTLGRDFGTEVEVLDGVNDGDLVIINPPDSLVTGAEVRVAQSGGGGK
ncbi:MAG: efflux RND transporter periplasmic adaptor subunit [Candidatus Acidiferrales bacterium]